MSDKLYQAKRSGSRCDVTVKGEPLPTVRAVQIDGDQLPVAEFAWGDDSDGSKYLAYCILHDFAPDMAKPLFLAFHDDFISQITDDEWKLTGEELKEGIAFWCDKMRPMQPCRPGEEMKRIVIPSFIYRAFIKSVNLAGTHSASKTPSGGAPLLHAAK